MRGWFLSYRAASTLGESVRQTGRVDRKDVDAMRGIFTIVFVLTIGVVPAQARNLATLGGMDFFVAPNGNDLRQNRGKRKTQAANDCTKKSSPCRTPQHACEEAMNKWDYGGISEPFIRLSAGRYSSGCILTGQPVGAHTINIVGEQSRHLSQSCTLSQAERVVIDVSSGAAFDIQDLAIAVVRCMTIQGQGTAFNCRQTPASDIAYIKFGGTAPLGRGVTANDECGINLGGTIWIGNDVSIFLLANNLSRIVVADNLPIVATTPVSVGYFALSYQTAIVDIRGGVTITGPITSSAGSRVFRNGSIFSGGLPLPGGCTQTDPLQPGNCW
jgi:hypothetical protein